MNPQTERLFLAIWPDASLREQLGRHVEQWDWGAGAALRDLAASPLGGSLKARTIHASQVPGVRGWVRPRF